MLHDRTFRPRRIGRYEVFAYFELRSFGFLFRWGKLSSGPILMVHLGPFGAAFEPATDD